MTKKKGRGARTDSVKSTSSIEEEEKNPKMSSSASAASPAQAAASPASTPPPVPVPPIDEKSLLQFAEGLRYDGFNPEHTRKKVKEAGMKSGEVMRVIIIGSLIGNNFDRLEGSVADEKIGAAANKMLRTFRFVENPVNKDSLTIPRVMAAYAPLTYQVRKLISAKLQNQSFGTGCPVELQTPSLALYSTQGSVQSEWLLRFAIAIKRKGWTDEEAMRNAEMFREIAVTNSAGDPKLARENMGKPIKDLLEMFDLH